MGHDTENELKYTDSKHEKSTSLGTPSSESVTGDETNNSNYAASSYSSSKPINSEATAESSEAASSSSTSHQDDSDSRYQAHPNPLKAMQQRGHTTSDEYRKQVASNFRTLTSEVFSKKNADVFFTALARINYLLNHEQTISNQDKALLRALFPSEVMKDNPFSILDSNFTHPHNFINGVLNQLPSSQSPAELKTFISRTLALKFERLKVLAGRIKSKELLKELSNLAEQYFLVKQQVDALSTPNLDDFYKQFPLLNIVFDTQTNWYYRVSDEIVEAMTFTKRPTGEENIVKRVGGSHLVSRHTTDKGSLFVKLGNEKKTINLASEHGMNSLAMQLTGFRQPLISIGGMAIHAPQAQTRDTIPISTDVAASSEQSATANGKKRLILSSEYQHYHAQYSQGIDNGFHIHTFCQMNAATFLLANQPPTYKAVLTQQGAKKIDNQALDKLIQIAKDCEKNPQLHGENRSEAFKELLSPMNLNSSETHRQQRAFEDFNISPLELSIGLQWHAANDKQPQGVSLLMLGYLGKFVVLANQLFPSQSEITNRQTFINQLAQDLNQFIDVEALTDLIVFESISHPQDGKVDNYMIEPVLNSGRLQFRVVGIDNDLRSPKELGDCNGSYLLTHRSILPHLVTNAMSMPSGTNQEKLAYRLVNYKFPERILISWLHTLNQQQASISAGVQAGAISEKMLDVTNISHRIDFNLLTSYYVNLQASRSAIVAGNTRLVDFIRLTTPHVAEAYHEVVAEKTTSELEYDVLDIYTAVTKHEFNHNTVLCQQDRPFSIEYHEKMAKHLSFSPEQAINYLLLNLDLSIYEQEPPREIRFNNKNISFSMPAIVADSILSDTVRLGVKAPGIRLSQSQATEALILRLLMAAQQEQLTVDDKKVIALLYASGASFEKALTNSGKTFISNDKLMTELTSLRSQLQQGLDIELTNVERLLSDNLEKIHQLGLIKKSSTDSKKTLTHIAGILLEKIYQAQSHEKENYLTPGSSTTREQALLDLICDNYDINPEELEPLTTESDIPTSDYSDIIINHCLLAKQKNQLQYTLSQPNANYQNQINHNVDELRSLLNFKSKSRTTEKLIKKIAIQLLADILSSKKDLSHELTDGEQVFQNLVQAYDLRIPSIHKEAGKLINKEKKHLYLDVRILPLLKQHVQLLQLEKSLPLEAQTNLGNNSDFKGKSKKRKQSDFKEAIKGEKGSANEQVFSNQPGSKNLG